MKKPLNILFLCTDQQRFDALGVVNPAIKTPNLDRLAQTGLHLPQAYSPTPVCLPCRASLVTGQFPSTHRATCNSSYLPEDYPFQVATPLRQAGYRTHFIGKSHLSNCHDPKSKESAPQIHDREYYRQWHGPWYGFEHATLNIGHSTESHACGMHYGVWLEDQGIDTDRYFGNTEYTDYGAWDLPGEFHNSRWVADQTIDSMTRSQKEGKPFYIWSNFQDPHNPCMVPEPWASMYDPREVPFQGLTPEDQKALEEKPRFYREVLEKPGPYAAQPSDPGLPGAGDIASLDYTDEQARECVAAYYGMVSLLDHHVGRIIDWLEEKGLRENTLIVFTSDHGDCLGDHGYWFKSMVTYDESMRVPLLASCPGLLPEGRTNGEIHNLLDLFPTLFTLADIPVPSYLEGRDLSATWREPRETVTGEAVVEEKPFRTDWNKRSLVTPDFVIAFYANRSYGELYDREKDPQRWRNLWNHPDYQSVKAELLTRLLSLECNKSKTRLPPSRCLD